MTRSWHTRSPALEPVGVAHFGLGTIGQAVAAVAMSRPGLRSVAAADANADLWGRDLGELIRGQPNGVPIRSAERLSLPRDARVALHCTSSSLQDVATQLRLLITHGLSVIST